MTVYLGDKPVGVTIRIADPISNKAYAAQLDVLANISEGKAVVEENYTDEKMEKLETDLINLVGVINEQV